VIVTLTTTLVMQMSADYVVGVVAMGDGFVAAPGPMLVFDGMTSAVVPRCMFRRIGSAHRNYVIVDMIAVKIVHVAVVQVVRVSLVLDAAVSAPWPVPMRMVAVSVALLSHD
jgi:hypothetical protein